VEKESNMAAQATRQHTAAEAETATYNARYADYVTRRAALYASTPRTDGTHMTINEDDLLNAHDWASGNEHVAPPDGFPQAKPFEAVDEDGNPVCSRCFGGGMGASFPHINGGRCFECGKA
jgi:hypothetical protein